MSYIKVIVFLGPSLSYDEAKKIMPSALFFPPIRCGDLLQCLKLDPTHILIIDGYFERIPTVWHKEILYAMEKGIKIYGAASIGALRAAELSLFGMVGIGKIYEQYQSNQLEDDDEVAVLHHVTPDYQYIVVSDAMVNIRATIEKACRQTIISPTEAVSVITAGKKLYYKNRTLLKACELSELTSDKQTELIKFSTNGGYLNLKAEDTKLALAYVQQDLHNKKSNLTVKTENTLFLRTLKYYATTKAFPYAFDSSPLAERYEIASRLYGEKYLYCFRLAMLMSKVYAIALELGMHPDTKFTKPLSSQALNASIDLKEKILLINQVVHYYPSSLTSNDIEIIESFEASNSEREHLAKLYSVISGRATTIGLKINQIALERYILNFRKKYGLLNRDLLKNWLKKRNIPLAYIENLLCQQALVNYTVYCNNFDLMCHSAPDSTYYNWFFLALTTTEFYTQLVDTIHHPQHWQQLIQKFTESYQAKGLPFLNSLGFIDENDSALFLSSLSSLNGVKQE